MLGRFFFDGNCRLLHLPAREEKGALDSIRAGVLRDCEGKAGFKSHRDRKRERGTEEGREGGREGGRNAEQIEKLQKRK